MKMLHQPFANYAFLDLFIENKTYDYKAFKRLTVVLFSSVPGHINRAKMEKTVWKHYHLELSVILTT
jgi:hypothetical protein